MYNRKPRNYNYKNNTAQNNKNYDRENGISKTTQNQIPRATNQNINSLPSYIHQQNINSSQPNMQPTPNISNGNNNNNQNNNTNNNQNNNSTNQYIPTPQVQPTPQNQQNVMPQQNEYFPLPNIAPTYLQDYIKNRIGEYVKITVLIGPAETVVETGFLKDVGRNYIVLRNENNTNDSMVDLYSIKLFQFPYNINVDTLQENGLLNTDPNVSSR